MPSLNGTLRRSEMVKFSIHFFPEKNAEDVDSYAYEQYYNELSHFAQSLLIFDIQDMLYHLLVKLHYSNRIEINKPKINKPFSKAANKCLSLQSNDVIIFFFFYLVKKQTF